MRREEWQHGHVLVVRPQILSTICDLQDVLVVRVHELELSELPAQLGCDFERRAFDEHVRHGDGLAKWCVK